MLIETERKEGEGQKEAFRETGRAGRPDPYTGFSSISRRNRESYDRYVRVTHVSLLTSHDLESSGS